MAKKNAEEELITISEAAKIRGVSEDAIRKLIRRGRLRNATRYGRILVYLQEVEGFEKKKPPGPRPRKKPAK